MNIDMLLYRGALLAYLISTLTYIFSLLIRRVSPARAATWVLTVAFGLHTLFFLGQWLSKGYNPFLRVHDMLSFFAWVMAASIWPFNCGQRPGSWGPLSPPWFLSS